MLRMPAVLTVIILAVAAFALSACGDDATDDNGGPTKPPQTDTATPGVPTAEPETAPTGIAAIDLAIEALANRDFDAFRALLLLAPEACVAPGQGSGGPPDCESGEAVGTPVDVIPAASCEGFWLREDALFQALGPLFQATPRLYGVYRADAQLFDRVGEYAMVVDISIPEGPMAANVIMTAEGVVGVNFGCGETAAQMVNAGGFTDAVFVPGGVAP